jgi:hypothetical protein
MKILIIGDVHESDFWVDYVQKNKDRVEKIVFMGDYFDSFKKVSAQVASENFKKILALRESLGMEKVILLIGNHDFHYTKFCMGRYSGFSTTTFVLVGSLLDELIDNGTLVLSHQEGGYLFSHAGISETWFKEMVGEDANVEDINHLFKQSPRIVEFRNDERTTSQYGDNVHQSPIWIRPNSLSSDPYGDYHQVVGHTAFDFSGIDSNRVTMDNGKNIYFTDSNQHEAFILDTETGESEILR